MDQFEQRILAILLDGDHPALHVLRQQLGRARVLSRDFTGSGCFTTFEVEAGVELTDPPSFRLRDVWFRLSGCENEGAVILFVDNGRLEALEVHNWSDDWPDAVRIEDAGYLKTSTEVEPEKAVGLELAPAEERDSFYLQFQITRRWETGSG